ncbi:MAG: CsgG/HfaB family protein [bacterium]
MYTIYYRNNFIFILSALFILTLCSCTVKRPIPCVKDGRQYGLIDELIVSYEWDSCYKRALSYAEGECWQQAGEEFRAAISQRTKDQWRARTYGMHILDQYFPHRELGIAYLQQGMIDTAIDELTTSIEMTKSSKALYYLDQARKKKLESGDLDHDPPHITVYNDNMYDTTIYTNESHFLLKGSARDNYFVASLRVNEKPVYISVSEPEVPLAVKVNLTTGLNELSIKAQDLVKNRSEMQLYILLDQEGPTVVVNKETSRGETVRLQGLIFDSGGLAHVSFGKQSISLHPDEKYKEFSYTLSKRDSLFFIAKDRAGNITEGDLLDTTITSTIQLAESRAIVNDTLAVSYAHEGPVIRLFEHTPVVFQPTVVIKGIIRSEKELKNIWINNRRVFIFKEDKGLNRLLKRMWYGPRTNFYFTKIVDGLEEGYNEIIIKAQDSEGRSTQERVEVEYRIKEFEKIGNRWSLGILPFALFEGPEYHFASPRPHPLGRFQEELQYVFFNSQRFNLLERERIEAVMQELGLQSSSAVDKKTGPAVGRLLSAEVILPGSITESWDGYDRCIHVIARLVDVETGEILSIKDVYGPWRSIEDEQYVLEGLAQMFVEEFPLLKGIIIENKGNAVKVNLGAEERVHDGMRLMLFGSDESILGEARITEVKSNYSIAKPYQKELLEIVKAGDIVVTK